MLRVDEFWYLLTNPSRSDCFRPSDRLAGWDSHPRRSLTFTAYRIHDHVCSVAAAGARHAGDSGTIMHTIDVGLTRQPQTSGTDATLWFTQSQYHISLGWFHAQSRWASARLHSREVFYRAFASLLSSHLSATTVWSSTLTLPDQQTAFSGGGVGSVLTRSTGTERVASMV